MNIAVCSVMYKKPKSKNKKSATFKTVPKTRAANSRGQKSATGGLSSQQILQALDQASGSDEDEDDDLEQEDVPSDEEDTSTDEDIDEV